MEALSLMLELAQLIIRENRGIVTLETIRLIQHRHKTRESDLFYQVQVSSEFELRHALTNEESGVRAISTLLTEHRTELGALVGPVGADRRLRDQTVDFLQAKRGEFERLGLVEGLPDPLRDQLRTLRADTEFARSLATLPQEEATRRVYERLIGRLLASLHVLGADLEPIRSFLAKAAEKEPSLQAATIGADRRFRLASAAPPIDRTIGVLGRFYDYCIELAAGALGRREAIAEGRRVAAELLLCDMSGYARLGILQSVMSGALSPIVSLGVPGIERVVGAEVGRGSAILLVGPRALEQRLLVAQFAVRGLAHGESVLLVTGHETAEEAADGLRSLSIDPGPYLERGLLQMVDWCSLRENRPLRPVRRGSGTIIRAPPDMLGLNQAVLGLLQQPAVSFVARAVLDFIGIALTNWDALGTARFTARVVDRIRKHGYTALYTLPEDAAGEALGLLTPAFDYVLHLSLERFGGDVHYALGAVKGGPKGPAGGSRLPVVMDREKVRVLIPEPGAGPP